MKKRFQKIWHDLFFKYAPKFAIKYAMTCRQFVDEIDLSDSASSKKMQMALHASLCKTCRNYKELNQIIRGHSQRGFKKTDFSLLIKEINKSLISKYSPKDKL